MSSRHFNVHKEKLAARKKTLSSLENDIEQRNQEREEAAKQRTNLTDRKYAGSQLSIYDRAWEEDETGSVTGSTAAGDTDMSKMMKTPGKKMGSKKLKKRKPGGTPSAPGGPGKKLGPKKKTKKKKKKLSLATTDNTSLARRSGSPSDASSGKKTSDDADIDDEDEDDEEEEDDDEEDEEQGFLHTVEALHCFENARFIFMQRLVDYVELEAVAAANTKKKKKAIDLAYQILNVQGQLLFLMQQNKVRCTGFIIYSKKSFENIIYDIYGNKVLKYIGPPVIMSRMMSKMVVTDANNRTLGYIKAFGNKVNYSVYNAIGERLFLVVSNLYIPTATTDFTILCRGQKIGVIKYAWKHSFQELNFIDYETSGIEFPSEMDEREKALLLGCLMLIEFFWYSPVTRLKLSLFFIGLFLVVLAIFILCIPIMIDNPGDHPKTKSYYVAEKVDKIKKADGSKFDGSQV